MKLVQLFNTRLKPSAKPKISNRNYHYIFATIIFLENPVVAKVSKLQRIGVFLK